MNLCPVCGFRDIIPSEAQRPKYEAMVKKAREEWLASQRQSDEEYHKEALEMAREAMRAAERRQRESFCALCRDSALMPPGTGPEHKFQEDILFQVLLLEIGRREKAEGRAASAKEDETLKKQLDIRSDTFWKKYLEQYALEKEKARRQDRAAYLDGARKYAEDSIRRKWKELEVKARLEGKPEPPAMDSGEGRKIFLMAVDKAGSVAANAEEEPGRPAAFEEDKALKGRLTRTVGTALAQAFQGLQGIQGKTEPKALPAGQETYLAEAEKRIRSIVSEVFEEQYQALQKVYPACALPSPKGGRCQALQTETGNEMLLRVQEHQKTGNAKERFFQERLLISAIREDASSRIRSRLTAMIEGEMGKFRSEYMTLALARSSEMARIAYRAVWETKTKRAAGSAEIYPLMDSSEGGKLIAKCKKELEALLRREILTRHMQVAAGYEADQGMQDMLRTAAVKFYMENLLPVKKTASGAGTTAAARQQQDAGKVRRLCLEEFEKAYSQLQAEYPEQVLPLKGSADCSEIKKHASDAGLSRFSAWRRGELKEKCPTETALHDLVRKEMADQYRIALKQLAERKMQPLMHAYLQAGGEFASLLAKMAYKRMLAELEEARKELVFPGIGSEKGRKILEAGVSSCKKQLETDAQKRRGKVAAGFSKDQEEQKTLETFLRRFFRDRIMACAETRPKPAAAAGPGRPASSLGAGGSQREGMNAAVASRVISSVLQEQRQTVKNAGRLICSDESPAAFQKRMAEDARVMIQKNPSEKSLTTAIEAHVREEYAKRANTMVTELGCRVNAVERRGIFGKKTVREKRIRLNMPGQDDAAKRPVLSNVREGDILRLYWKDSSGKEKLCKATLSGRAKGLATIWTEQGEDGKVMIRIGDQKPQESILWKNLWCW